MLNILYNNTPKILSLLSETHILILYGNIPIPLYPAYSVKRQASFLCLILSGLLYNLGFINISSATCRSSFPASSDFCERNNLFLTTSLIRTIYETDTFRQPPII